MNLSPGFLYLCAVLIWGTTFYAIRFQLGEVSPVVSVMWRFLLAAAVLFAWIYIKRLPCRFSHRQHGWIALQGVFLFSINYVLVYIATFDLTTGLVAVIFAGVVGMNIFNGVVFLGKSISLPVLAGALLGTLGLALVFWPEVRAAGKPAI
ncbi:MAG: EamA family transporter, partial [Granulosicoccaceae bacterium]